MQGLGMRVISFSADGVREAAGEGFYDWVLGQDADFICIQDLRCSEYDLQDNSFFPPDYNAYFFDDVGGKANGVAIYCRELPKAIMTGLGFAEFDMQGRYIQADYAEISVGCLLAPEATSDEEQERKDEFFSLLGNHLQKVRNKRRKFIISGNWQLAPEALDVQGPASQSPASGFLATEQAWMQELLENGYVDAYRCVSRDDAAFTFWPAERGSDGRRIDLQVISEELKQRVEYGAVYTGARFSRHAPLIMDYDIDL
jgi:exodeoxyribonuclease-3